MYTEPLLRFAAQTGIGDAAVREAESPRSYYLHHRLKVADLLPLDVETVATLQERFGRSFHLEIGIENALPEIEVDHNSPNNWRSRLDQLKERAPELTLQLILEIEKDTLLRQLTLDHDQPAHLLIFFFHEHFLSLLGGRLEDVEYYLFPEPFQHTAILLDDAPFLFHGPLLTLTGPDRFGTAVAESAQLGSRVRTRLEHYYSARGETLNWIGFHLESLTPLHFVGSWEGAEENEFSSIITRRLLEVCVLYTANRVGVNQEVYHAVYASTDNVTTLALAGDIDLDCRISVLHRLAIWPYSGHESDRLTFFQNIVARNLSDDNPQENYRAFIGRLRQLLNDARWHNRVFLESRIDVHFQQIEAIADYASETANEIAGQLDTMTRGLVEGLLGAVAVIVLTLLGAAIDDKSGGLLVTLGMWAYIIHLLLFQMLYRLGSIRHSHHLVEQDAADRYGAYAEQIGQKRVEELWQPLQRRFAQFQLWFRITVAVYIGVIILLATLSLYAPPRIAALQATPTPTSLPTSTPTSASTSPSTAFP